MAVGRFSRRTASTSAFFALAFGAFGVRVLTHRFASSRHRADAEGAAAADAATAAENSIRAYGPARAGRSERRRRGKGRNGRMTRWESGIGDGSRGRWSSGRQFPCFIPAPGARSFHARSAIQSILSILSILSFAFVFVSCRSSVRASAREPPSRPVGNSRGDRMDRINRITKMTRAAAWLVSPAASKRERGTAARGRWRSGRRSPVRFRPVARLDVDAKSSSGRFGPFRVFVVRPARARLALHVRAFTLELPVPATSAWDPSLSAFLCSWLASCVTCAYLQCPPCRERPA